MADQLQRLALFDSKAVLGMQTLPTGTHTFPLETQGNSILSTLWVKSADPGASIQVNYWDFGPGGGEFASERVNLRSHALILAADAPKTDRVIVTRMHNKPRLEVVIAGGAVEFGVYVSVVSQFASDLDNALILDGAAFDPLVNLAMPTAVLDDSDGKLYFLRGTKGKLSVEQDLGTPVRLFAADTATTTMGGTVSLASTTVPVGKVWRLRSLSSSTRAWGQLRTYADAAEIEGSRITHGPASENGRHVFDPFVQYAAGTALEIEFTQTAGPSVDIAAVLYITEEDA